MNPLSRQNETANAGLLYVRNFRENYAKVSWNGVDVTRNQQIPLLFRFRRQDKHVEPNGQCSPISLFLICQQFVVDNLRFVDSLQGFPAQIGEKLFAEAVRRQYLTLFNSESLEILQLFVDPYKAFLIHQINCNGLRQLFANPAWSHFKVLLQSSTLVKLDLSDCNLGDDDEIWKCFNRFSNLIVLNLANNYITSDGVRLFTISTRCAQQGPTNLAYLNLSGNHYLDKCALPLILKGFCHLETIDLSETLIEFSDCSNLTSVGFVLLESVSEINDIQNMNSIETVGWAKDLVEEWKNLLSKKATTHLNFYGKLAGKAEGVSKQQDDHSLIFHKINTIKSDGALISKYSPILKRRKTTEETMTHCDEGIFSQYM